MKNHPKVTSEITMGFSRQKMAAMFFAIFAIFLFGLSGSCWAYVTPDWAAQERANERQELHSKPYVFNLQKELKNNKRQQVKGKKAKTSKLSEKRRSARQKPKGKPYKYDRKAELRRNAPQKVK